MRRRAIVVLLPLIVVAGPAQAQAAAPDVRGDVLVPVGDLDPDPESAGCH